MIGAVSSGAVLGGVRGPFVLVDHGAPFGWAKRENPFHACGSDANGWPPLCRSTVLGHGDGGMGLWRRSQRGTRLEADRRWGIGSASANEVTGKRTRETGRQRRRLFGCSLCTWRVDAAYGGRSTPIRSTRGSGPVVLAGPTR
jgi:hypothetical protein